MSKSKTKRERRVRKVDPLVVHGDPFMQKVHRIAASQALIRENARRLVEHLRAQEPGSD